VTPSDGLQEERLTRTRLWWLRPLRARELLFWQVLCPFVCRRRKGSSASDERVALELTPSVSLRLSTSDAGHLAIEYCGFAELALTRRVLRLAKTGGMLVDVGANYGYFTCIWAAVPGNQVVAFEPAPAAFAALEENVAANGLADRVTLHRVAVSSASSTARFIDSPGRQSGLSHLASADAADSGEVVVEVTTLDAAFADDADATIEVLKVDAEGADTWVLVGAETLLRAKRIRNLFFEYDETLNQRFGIEPFEAQRFLRSCGYDVRRIGRFLWTASAVSV